MLLIGAYGTPRRPRPLVHELALRAQVDPLALPARRARLPRPSGEPAQTTEAPHRLPGRRGVAASRRAQRRRRTPSVAPAPWLWSMHGSQGQPRLVPPARRGSRGRQSSPARAPRGARRTRGRCARARRRLPAGSSTTLQTRACPSDRRRLPTPRAPLSTLQVHLPGAVRLRGGRRGHEGRIAAGPRSTQRGPQPRQSPANRDTTSRPGSAPGLRNCQQISRFGALGQAGSHPGGREFESR